MIMCHLDKVQKDDNNIYKCSNKYYFLLPKKENYSHDIFMIDDYFTENLKMNIVNDKINELNGNMKDLNINIGSFVKKRLPNYKFNDNYFDSFKVLLDKLMNIIEGTGPLEEVG